MPAGARAIVRRKSWVALMAIAVAGAIAALAADAGNRQLASLVFGQADFFKNAPNFVDAAAMSAPRAVAIDTSVSPNHVWVADTGNNRVLGWNDASTYLSGATADIVIGQPDFLSSAPNQGGTAGAATLSAPAGVGVDGAGNLYVGDRGNNRVMVFSAPFAGSTTADQAASAVFGQGGSFVTTAGCASGAVSALTLCDPEGVALDGAGNLFVADAGDNRVTIYFAPFAGQGVTLSQPANTSADLWLGQAAASGSQCNQGASAALDTLCFAVNGSAFGGVGVTLDAAGDLFVADTGNDRALEYNGPYGAQQANPSSAHLVFSNGQYNVADPAGVAVDGAGNLYVGWNSGDEILVYKSAVALSNVSPNYSIGTGATDPSSGSFSNLDGLAIDGSGDLYVADTGYNRVLEFNSGAGVASGVLGQTDLSHGGINRVDGIGIDAPGGVAAGIEGTRTVVYAADTANNRVLGWVGPQTPASGAADIVIGQSDFISSQANAGGAESGATMSAPAGVATDSSGNLFVADSANNRVLEFADPAASCSPYPCADRAPAIAVFGTCGNFAENGCAANTVSAASLLDPSAVGFDRAGNLFISDRGNSRVLEFAPPFAASPAAIRVFGQGGNFSGNQCNAGALSNSSLCSPGGLAVDSAGDLFVADTGNNRALEFAAPFPSPSAAPSSAVVFGQDGSFTMGMANLGGISAASLDAPAAVALDSHGDLFIADASNSRVLEFNPPFQSSPIASAVFGQSGFSTGDGNDGLEQGDLGGLGPDSLFAPDALALDAADDLYVADTGNNRMLMYADPAPSPSPTPSATASATASATVSATATVSPTATATASATATATATVTATPTATPTPVAQKLIIAPRRINFGKVKVGASRSRTVYLINKKTKRAVAVIIESVPILDPPFAIDNQCPRVLAPGARCAIGVTVKPVVAAPANATLMIRDNALGAQQSVAIRAIGK
jgi:sugar lactone lactonase YvrE